MASPDGEAELDWVVCLGKHREAVAGAVACPLAHAPVSVRDCLECRHLSHLPDDRQDRLWCSTPDVTSSRSS